MLEHPILAIDHGEARIGLAITDPIGILASPLETIQVASIDPVTRISEIVNDRQVKAILIGLPLRMDGSEGTAATKIRRFKNQLLKDLPASIQVDFIDESLTTVDATKKLQQAGKKAHQQRNIIDQAAAVEILNRYMQSNDNPFGLEPDPDSFY